MTHAMTALTMQFHVYDCHFCNKTMLKLRFWPVTESDPLLWPRAFIIMQWRPVTGRCLFRGLDQQLVAHVVRDVWRQDGAAHQGVLAHVPLPAHGLVVGVEAPGDAPQVEARLELRDAGRVAHALHTLPAVACNRNDIVTMSSLTLHIKHYIALSLHNITK